MTAAFKWWRPTKPEADLLIDMLTARMPKEIAAFLIDVRTLTAFMHRLSAAADAPCPEPLPFRPPPPKGPPASRIVADRLFYREDGQ
jgi:hypothetical protein